MQKGKLGQMFKEGANVKAVRGLMIALAAVVVLSVSSYGTVIYIQLMSKVFPDGPLLLACYMGAAANILLMVVLLVGKFVWFRPGAHEVASWIVTGVELVVSVLNLMLAYELASGHHLTSLMQAWYYLAPVSPIFSMVGAIVLIMTSTELRTKHKQMEAQEEKDQAEREFDLAMHQAEMEVKHQYLGFVKTNLAAELNAPERQLEMKDHAAMLVSEVLSGLSGLQSVPRLRAASAPAALPNAQTVEQAKAPAARAASESAPDETDAWLESANARIEQVRRQRVEQVGRSAAAAEEVVKQLVRSLLPMVVEAERHGGKLREVERMLGIEVHPESTMVQRLERVVRAALRMGYSADEVMALARKYLAPAENVGVDGLQDTEGGEDAKKK